VTQVKDEEARSMAIVSAILVVARIVLVLASNVYIQHWDTGHYYEAAHDALSGLFTHHTRAPLYPLLLKVLGYHVRTLVVIQTIIASVAWVWLAFTLAKWFPDRRVQWVALLGF
jgi:hypothetical protein